MHMKKTNLKRYLLGTALIMALCFALIIQSRSLEMEALASSAQLGKEWLSVTEGYLHLDIRGSNSFKLSIRKGAKQEGASYSWYVKADKGNPKAVVVDKDTGIVTAKEAGVAYVRCKVTLKDGRILRPEAKVTVRNNISQVDISNIPEKMQILAGQEMDFNRVILNTYAGKGKSTKAITRWELRDDTANINTVTDKGVVFPTKEGRFSIRAVSFQSKARYNQWLEDKEVYQEYITASSDWYTIEVASSKGEARVKNQEQLEKALKEKALKEIYLISDKKTELVIGEGDYKDKTLILDSPNISLLIGEEYKEDRARDAIESLSISNTILGRIVINHPAFIRIGENVIINWIETYGALILSGAGRIVRMGIQESGVEIGEGIEVNPDDIVTKEDVKLQIGGETYVGTGEKAVPIGERADEQAEDNSDNRPSVIIYRLTYNSNSENIASPSPFSGKRGVKTTLPTLERRGYILRGWDRNRQAAEPEYIQGQEITLSENMTLYAIWEEMIYDVDIAPVSEALTYGQLLTESKITPGVLTYKGEAVAGSWSWSDETIRPRAGNTKQQIKFTPENIVQYPDAIYEIPVNVAKKEIYSITGITASDKVYDGNNMATMSTEQANYEGIVQGDVLGLTGGRAFFDNRNVGRDKEVRWEEFELSGSDKGNYELSKELVSEGIKAKASITSCPITRIDGIRADDKIYNRETDVVIYTDNLILIGMVVGDDLGLSIGGSAFEDKNAGDDKKIICTELLLTGVDKNNYALTEEARDVNIRAGITEKEITAITGFAAKDKVYDGRDTASIKEDISLILTGILEGDDLILDPDSGIMKFTSVNVGKDIEVTWTDFKLSGEDGGNYVLSESLLTDELITKANITKRTVSLEGQASLKNITFDLVMDSSEVEGAGTRSYTLTVTNPEDAASLSKEDIEFASSDEELAVAEVMDYKVTDEGIGIYSIKVTYKKGEGVVSARTAELNISISDSTSENIIITNLESLSVSVGESLNKGTSIDKPILITQDNIKLFNAYGCTNDGAKVGLYYKLIEDITLEDVGEDESNWLPMGIPQGPAAGYFYSSIDGDGYTITGMKIYSSQTSGAGSLGMIRMLAGKVQNLNLADIDISSNSTSYYYYVGGIAGTLLKSITGCSVTGSIKSESSAGGIAGENFLGKIENSYTDVDINGSGGLGGIVGVLESEGDIKNCYALGSVKSNGGVGGIVGSYENSMGRYGSIRGCVALNQSVSNTNARLGQIIGYNLTYHTDKLNYYAIVEDSYARADMGMVYSGTDRGEAYQDGIDLFSPDMTVAWWNSIGFNTENGWTVTEGYLPYHSLDKRGEAIRSPLPTISSTPAKVTLAVSGSAITVTGGAISCSVSVKGREAVEAERREVIVGIGKQITVVATAGEDYDFLYWIDENNNSNINNTNYTFTVSGDIRLTAYFKKKDE